MRVCGTLSDATISCESKVAALWLFACETEATRAVRSRQTLADIESANQRVRKGEKNANVSLRHLGTTAREEKVKRKAKGKGSKNSANIKQELDKKNTCDKDAGTRQLCSSRTLGNATRGFANGALHLCNHRRSFGSARGGKHSDAPER